MLTQIDRCLQDLIDDDRDFRQSQQWQEFERRERAVIEAERARWDKEQMSFDDWLNTPDGQAWFESELDAYDERHGHAMWIGEAW